MSGLSYYKLRQFDTDGSWTDSHAAPVLFSSGVGSPIVYPNPVHDVAYLQGLPGGNVDLRVTDAAGRLVAVARKTGDSDRFEWPIGHLPPGAYTLTMNSVSGATSLRVMRQ